MADCSPPEICALKKALKSIFSGQVDVFLARRARNLLSLSLSTHCKYVPRNQVNGVGPLLETK